MTVSDLARESRVNLHMLGVSCVFTMEAINSQFKVLVVGLKSWEIVMLRRWLDGIDEGRIF